MSIDKVREHTSEEAGGNRLAPRRARMMGKGEGRIRGGIAYIDQSRARRREVAEQRKWMERSGSRTNDCQSTNQNRESWLEGSGLIKKDAISDEGRRREEEPGGLEIRQPIGSAASVNSDRVANEATRNWITKEDRSEGRITNPTNNLGTGAKSTNEGKGITNSSERERVENGRTPVDQLWRGITEEAEGSTRKESRLLSQDEGKGSLREVREPKRATGCHRVSDNPSTSERSAAPDAMADETARKGRGLPNREGEEGKCRSFVGGATGRSASARRSRGTRKWKGWRWIAKPGGARRYNERVEEVDYPAGRDGREGREHDRPGDHDEGTDRAVGSQKLSERE
ncbi:hypothetical protein BJ322DRAFT_1025611 [Thelephora terrestris]|uniref:Uncharacterized protein n=1 Tax=Thelephora terrestris TaxID=56493 RepID=A0A9P6H504_9AGAM|nr:hypothetical protein BJ322DRAFT_1025611 [Thelephora terrestris]